MRAFLSLALILVLTACGSAPSSAPSTGGGGAATGGAAQGGYQGELADHARYGKLIIASINLGKPSRQYLAEHEERIDAMVAARLQKAGYELLPTKLFADAWHEAVLKWGEPYNPTTGKLNTISYQYAINETVQTLARTSGAQAIVFTNLDEIQVYFSPTGSHQTRFLGVTRKPSSRGGEGVSGDFDWIQGVDAVGIYVRVFDMKLKQLFDGAGGIEVTETLDLKPSTPRWTRSKKILDNDDFIEEGITLALQPWITGKK